MNRIIGTDLSTADLHCHDDIVFTTNTPETIQVHVSQGGSLNINIDVDPGVSAGGGTAPCLTNICNGNNTASARGIKTSTEQMGQNAVQIGNDNLASGFAAFAQNNGTIASGGSSHAQGIFTIASGGAAHAEGYNSKATNNRAHAEGDYTIAGGIGSHAEGQETVAASDYSHAEGAKTHAGEYYAHSEGVSTTARGLGSHAEGYGTHANGEYSHAEGNNTYANGNYSHAQSDGTIANGYAQTTMGLFNVPSGDNSRPSHPTDDLLIIGNGTSNNARSNAFRVQYNGDVYASGNYYGAGGVLLGGADYAEMFEWLDGNPEGVDRRGLFVTLSGKKLRIANSRDSYLLGIVSATPAVLGNANSLDWERKYLKDKFGEVLTEWVDVETLTSATASKIEDDPNSTEPKIRPVANPDFDPTRDYVPRHQRREWEAVGMLGQLRVLDDGTCEVDGYCLPNDEGKATKAAAGYRVMERLAHDLILVLFR